MTLAQNGTPEHDPTVLDLTFDGSALEFLERDERMAIRQISVPEMTLTKDELLAVTEAATKGLRRWFNYFTEEEKRNVNLASEDVALTVLRALVEIGKQRNAA